jgi:hypothetical protein
MDNSSNKINVREHRRAIQRNYQHWEHKAHAETNKQTNKQKTHTHHVREHRWTIQRNYQHWEHKAHAETNKQTNKKPIHTTMRKQAQIT